MSLGNDPSRFDDEDEVHAAERVAEARQARRELARNGAAPSTEAILAEMGRDRDGREVPDGPDEFVPASEAARRALGRDTDDAARGGRRP